VPKRAIIVKIIEQGVSVFLLKGYPLDWDLGPLSFQAFFVIMAEIQLKLLL
jgi:hypothetical protein